MSSASEERPSREWGRYNVRALLPGPDGALHDALTHAGAPPETLGLLARHAAVEALAIDGLRADETRVMERFVAKLGGAVAAAPSGERVLLLIPLSAAGELAQHLREWGRATESLAAAVEHVLVTRLSPPPPWPLPGGAVETGARCVVIAPDDDATVAESRIAVWTGGDLPAGADVIEVSAAGGAATLWPLVAETGLGILLVADEDDDAALAQAFASALDDAVNAGVEQRRIWIQTPAHTASARAARRLRRLAQLRGLGVGVVAEMRGLQGGHAAACAALAREAGADAVRTAATAGVADALRAADALRVAG